MPSLLRYCLPFAPPLFPHGKGGLGIMAHQGYLPLESDDNEICWGPFGGHEWKGQGRRETQCVLFDGDSVAPFRWSALWKRPVIVRFTPDKIHVVDLRRLRKTYYLRRSRSGN